MPDQLTAQQVVERIQKNVGGPGKTTAADSIATGSPQTVIAGIATTFAPSFDVMCRALAVGPNLIVSRENPYWESRGEGVRIFRRRRRHEIGRLAV